jgi:serine/threonine protein kinase
VFGFVYRGLGQYVVGCLLHKAYTGRYPVLLPGREGVEVATQTGGSSNDERLIDLLSRCLRRDAALRTTAPEAAIHPYFTTSFVVRLD